MSAALSFSSQRCGNAANDASERCRAERISERIAAAAAALAVKSSVAIPPAAPTSSSSAAPASPYILNNIIVYNKDDKNSVINSIEIIKIKIIYTHDQDEEGEALVHAQTQHAATRLQPAT